MKIELKQISVKELTNGYQDNANEGITGFGNKLDIRPKYQREFVYKPKQQQAVIETIRKGFPLNVMYWAEKPDSTFEVLDGQQRTLSICGFVNGDFSINISETPMYFNNLTNQEKDQILNYELMVYFCSGEEREKLEWFRTINIAGEKLTEQELRNSVFTGRWLSDAKKYFSKPECAAQKIGDKFVNGSPIRQQYLETVLNWISNGDIEGYMAKNQHEPNAAELWQYFQSVITWIETTFPKYRKEQKGLDWGNLYNQFKGKRFDSDALETEITQLMQDDDVTQKKGIYEYILTRDSKHLNIRAFTTNQKRSAFEQQNGECPSCHGIFEIDQMEGDHITPWVEGGKTSTDNLQMLCKSCNRTKGKK